MTVTSSELRKVTARVKRQWPIPLALAVQIALGTPAHAFGTIDNDVPVAEQAKEHERITRLALAEAGFEPDSMDELAGAELSFGAVGAPDRPDRGLINETKAHCDGGDFLDIDGYPQNRSDAERQLAECRDWIFTALENAIVAAEDLLDDDGRIQGFDIPHIIPCLYNGTEIGRAKCKVFESFGLAIHAAQDFYAHSNWTDTDTGSEPTLTAPPGLGHDGPSPWLDPRQDARLPAATLSGCFEGVPETDFCQQRVRHLDLSKDYGDIDLETGKIGEARTPRGRENDNFGRAVRAAIADTRDKWDYLREQLIERHGEERGNRMICALLHDDPKRSCE